MHLLLLLVLIWYNRFCIDLHKLSIMNFIIMLFIAWRYNICLDSLWKVNVYIFNPASLLFRGAPWKWSNSTPPIQKNSFIQFRVMTKPTDFKTFLPSRTCYIVYTYVHPVILRKKDFSSSDFQLNNRGSEISSNIYIYIFFYRRLP